MGTNFEKLNLFFDRIKNISLWQRIFSWKGIRNLSYDAYEEFNTLIKQLNQISEEVYQTKNSIELLNKDIDHLKLDKAKLESSIDTVGQKVKQLTDENLQLHKENTAFKQSEATKQNDYEKKIEMLTGEIGRVRDERTKEQEDYQRSEIAKLESMKETWAKHQDKVKETIKIICQKHTIEYIDKVPFKGSPDNTIKICDELVVFDAKSPASNDLNNFPVYIKSQTESVKKYIKEENVRRDIFLVIPSNTVDVIDHFSLNMGDYNVYIVTLDVLEPLILSLKKIEEYEFVDQLSPEDRESICRVIGKFSYLTKRRIQIDYVFALECLNLLTKCNADLPTEILEKVDEFEKSEKWNPKQDKRAKQILTKELQTNIQKIQKEAEAKEIVFPQSLQKDLNSFPLYEGDDLNKTV